MQKQFSLEEIRETAIDLHESLRGLSVTAQDRPIFIAGLLIALVDPEFSDEYASSTTFDSVMTKIDKAIERVLNNANIDNKEVVKHAFKKIENNTTLQNVPLGHDNSIIWYLEQLEVKIKPMMNYSESTLDALGVFYHEFIKYNTSDGGELGIVLTPQHLTEFMCEIAGIEGNSKVVDICCGSGSFLVSAMAMMFKKAKANEYNRIRSEQLYGAELDEYLFTLAITNMIVRGDGKSNILMGDCFDKKIIEFLKSKQINIGLINPPFALQKQKNKDKNIAKRCELEFLENLLDILVIGGIACVVVPMSCAIGTKFKEIREKLFKKHTLKAVFSMPDDIFYPVGVNVCVMLWEAKRPHNIEDSTFFGYYKNDGYTKAKKKGRIDKFNRWESVKKEWVRLYKEREIKDGLTIKKCVTWKDEWLCEAYMETDYSKLNQADFEKKIKEYVAFKFLNNIGQ
jgi:type I restriction-modification system DNA methylase subunit